MDKSRVLSDGDIIELCTKQDQTLIEPFSIDNANGGSYVLRVGSIHKPIFEKPIREFDNKCSWVVKPGQMLLIVTHEKIKMPNDFVGIVFGTNHLTMQGLLIVNPGVITSGHQSEITFYAINFSKNNILLTEGDDISRIMFFQSKENPSNKRNRSVNLSAKQEASRNVKKNFHSDFEGYFKSLWAPLINKSIQKLFIGIVLGTLFFGALITTVSVIGTIIVDRVQSVPQLRQEIEELRKEISKDHVDQKSSGKVDNGKNKCSCDSPGNKTGTSCNPNGDRERKTLEIVADKLIKK